MYYMTVLYQRRHFNWFIEMIIELSLDDNQIDILVKMLGRTNSNFDEGRFRYTLDTAYHALEAEL